MRVADGADAEKVRREIAGIVGDDFTVRTRDEMNALFFRLVAYEKWGVFFISLLVLVLASFSVVGTLVMLMIEKRDDVATLRALGADTKAHSFDLRRRRTPDRRSGGVDRSRAGRRLLPGTATFRNDSHPGRYVVVIQLSRRDALERLLIVAAAFGAVILAISEPDRAECDEKQQTMI